MIYYEFFDLDLRDQSVYPNGHTTPLNFVDRLILPWDRLMSIVLIRCCLKFKVNLSLHFVRHVHGSDHRGSLIMLTSLYNPQNWDVAYCYRRTLILFTRVLWHCLHDCFCWFFSIFFLGKKFKKEKMIYVYGIPWKLRL